MSRPAMVDPADPHIAAELDRLDRAAAEMEREIAAGEAAARQFEADTVVLRAGLVAERAAAPAPVVLVVVAVAAAPGDGDGDGDVPPAPPVLH